MTIKNHCPFIYFCKNTFPVCQDLSHPCKIRKDIATYLWDEMVEKIAKSPTKLNRLNEVLK